MSTILDKITGRSFDRLFEKYNFLMKENRAIFATIDDQGSLSRITEDDVIRRLIDFGLLPMVAELQRLDNPYFYVVSFKNVVACEEFKVCCNRLSGIRFLFYGQISKDRMVRIRVLWTPLEIVLNSLKENLSRFGVVKKITPRYLSLDGNIKIISSPICIDIELSEGISCVDIPNIFVNQFGFKSYISIDSAAKLCFNCLGENHLCVDCPNPLCRKCGFGQPTSHVCGTSRKVVKYVFSGKSTSPKVNMISNEDKNVICDTDRQIENSMENNALLTDLRKQFDMVQSIDYNSQGSAFNYFEAVDNAMHEEERLQMEQSDIEEIKKMFELEYNTAHANKEPDKPQVARDRPSKKRKGRHK